jgi:hypothetical protein
MEASIKLQEFSIIRDKGGFAETSEGMDAMPLPHK